MKVAIYRRGLVPGESGYLTIATAHELAPGETVEALADRLLKQAHDDEVLEIRKLLPAPQRAQASAQPPALPPPAGLPAAVEWWREKFDRPMRRAEFDEADIRDLLTIAQGSAS